MSFRVGNRILTSIGLSALLWLAWPAAASAQTFGIPCGVECGPRHCPPHYHVFVEGPPRLWWRHSCPHPICNPCDLPHFGYFETCWHKWPFPPDWTHCSAPPPAALVVLNPLASPNLPPSAPGATPSLRPGYSGPVNLPTPRLAPNSGGAGGFEPLPQPRLQQDPPLILNR